MTRHVAAPMPEAIRHFMRAGQDPARGTNCPWCQARAHQPCRIPSSGKTGAKVHQQRKDAWARLTACCTTCQVTPVFRATATVASWRTGPCTPSGTPKPR